MTTHNKGYKSKSYRVRKHLLRLQFRFIRAYEFYDMYLREPDYTNTDGIEVYSNTSWALRRTV